MAILSHVKAQIRNHLNLRYRQLEAERKALEEDIEALAKRLNQIIRDQSIISHQIGLNDAVEAIDDTTKNPVFALRVWGWRNAARADHAGV